MIFDAGVSLEQIQLLSDRQYWINREGKPVEFMLHNEAAVSRDKYNSIKKHNVPPTERWEMMALVTDNPSSLQLEKAGIRNECSCIITTAMQDWIDKGIDPNLLDFIRAEVFIYTSVYKIQDMKFGNQTGDNFSIVVFGLIKK